MDVLLAYANPAATALSITLFASVFLFSFFLLLSYRHYTTVLLPQLTSLCSPLESPESPARANTATATSAAPFSLWARFLLLLLHRPLLFVALLLSLLLALVGLLLTRLLPTRWSGALLVFVAVGVFATCAWFAAAPDYQLAVSPPEMSAAQHFLRKHAQVESDAFYGVSPELFAHWR